MVLKTKTLKLNKEEKKKQKQLADGPIHTFIGYMRSFGPNIYL